VCARALAQQQRWRLTGIRLLTWAVGMELMGGAFHYCSDRFVLLEHECVGEDEAGVARRWLNFNRNFDWFGEAWMSVFIVGTQDDWQEVLYASTDSAKIGHGSQRHTQDWLIIYYGCLIIAVAFLQMNMWTGVFVHYYYKATVAIDNEILAGLNARAAKKRRKWPKRIDLPFIESAIERDKDWFRKWRLEHGYRLPIKKFCVDDRFDQLIALGIVVNVVFMTIQSYKPSAWQRQAQDVQDLFFTVLFSAEVAAKMYALHPQRFMLDGWYRFDYVISVISIAGIAIEESGEAFNVGSLTFV
jgi:hypothetical protein